MSFGRELHLAALRTLQTDSPAAEGALEVDGTGMGRSRGDRMGTGWRIHRWESDMEQVRITYETGGDPTWRRIEIQDRRGWGRGGRRLWRGDGAAGMVIQDERFGT